MTSKIPSLLLIAPFLIQLASAGPNVDAAAAAGGDASTAGASASAGAISVVPSLGVTSALGAAPAASLAAPSASVGSLPAIAMSPAASAAVPAPALAASAAAQPASESPAAAAPLAGKMALAGGRLAPLSSPSVNVPDGADAGRVRFDGQTASKPADETVVPAGSSAKTPAHVTEYRRLVDKIAANERQRREYMRSLPAGDSVRNDLLDHYAQVIAPEFAADERALADLVKAHPNVEYEAAGLFGRAAMRLTGRGPKKVEEGAAAPGMVRFNGADFPVVSFTKEWMPRAVDAARVSVELYLTQKDVTPELVAALVRAKARNVSLKIVGGLFSGDFMQSPLYAELRRAGIVIHYKIGVGDSKPVGVYDDGLVLRGSMNVSRNARDQAFIAENERGRVSSFDEELRAGWAQGSPSPRSVRFNSEFFAVVSEHRAEMVRAIDAAKVSVDLLVQEGDLTPEVIAALARAKDRNVALRLVGAAFSPSFMYGAVAAELRRRDIVIHYKTDLGKWPMAGVYDHALLVRSGANFAPGGQVTYFSEEDLGTLKSAEADITSGWDHGSINAPGSKK